MEPLSSGAEAVIFFEESDGVKRIIKERVPKAYRHPELDSQLRTSRTRREASILRKLPIFGPKFIATDNTQRIVMAYVEGKQVKELLDADPSIARAIGAQLAKLHDADIIHGDLTTSNMILHGSKVYFIDFGLSFTSAAAEDKAVDIHLFKQAVESKHHRVQEEAYAAFLQGYSVSRAAASTLERLKAVERRGRNKAKF